MLVHGTAVTFMGKREAEQLLLVVPKRTQQVEEYIYAAIQVRFPSSKSSMLTFQDVPVPPWRQRFHSTIAYNVVWVLAETTGNCTVNERVAI